VYHEIGRCAGFIAHDQVSQSDARVNVADRAGARLDVAAKLPIHPGPEEATVYKATHDRTFEGEKRDEYGKGMIFSDAQLAFR
jgi:hypothetical protein